MLEDWMLLDQLFMELRVSSWVFYLYQLLSLIVSLEFVKDFCGVAFNLEWLRTLFVLTKSKEDLGYRIREVGMILCFQRYYGMSTLKGILYVANRFIISISNLVVFWIWRLRSSHHFSNVSYLKGIKWCS